MTMGIRIIAAIVRVVMVWRWIIVRRRLLLVSRIISVCLRHDGALVLMLRRQRRK